jgi:ABC-type Fe3+-siderophore transport system permease subunit
LEHLLMTDRILSRCLWLIVMSLIAGSAMGSLMLIYSGLFRVIMRQFEVGGVVTGAGVALAAACWALCRHSDDLIDRRA